MGRVIHYHDDHHDNVSAYDYDNGGTYDYDNVSAYDYDNGGTYDYDNGGTYDYYHVGTYDYDIDIYNVYNTGTRRASSSGYTITYVFGSYGR